MRRHASYMARGEWLDTGYHERAGLVAVECTGVSSSIGSSVDMRPYVGIKKRVAASLCRQAVGVNRNMRKYLTFQRILHVKDRSSCDYGILDINR
jgi:hypothetical protein